MKFLHLADLHLGKRVNEFSMIEDQKYILNEILEIADDIRPDAVVIAGDIYDKSIPSTEAITLFDDFIFELCKRKIEVIAISGNHDSAERVSFGSRIMENSGVHLSHAFDGTVSRFTFEDNYGPVNFYLLPFIKPANVRPYVEKDIVSYDDAVKAAVEEMNVDKKERNILVTHQFVTGSLRSESEELSVGGTDNVDASAFENFDYVALGHLHRPQSCISDRIRYSGSPLKYSFSEAKDQKSVTVVDIAEKGRVNVTTVPLKPVRDMYELKGRYDDVVMKSFYENKGYDEAYIHITLTDEEDIPDAIGRLRTIYHNIMKLDYDNERTRFNNVIDGDDKIDSKSPMELFSEFYYQQNNAELSEKQKEIAEDIIKELWGN